MSANVISRGWELRAVMREPERIQIALGARLIMERMRIVAGDHLRHFAIACIRMQTWY